MRIKFWGVRGSTPTPQPENMRYGGNTSCVEVRGPGGGLLVLDCGTGFRCLGQHLLQEFAGRPVFAHIFVSHFHWDHIQGFPFFRPLYDKQEDRYYLHGSSRHRNFKEVMEGQMTAPYFPVDLREMRARREFCSIDEGKVSLDDVTVQTMWLNHPQGSLGFRLESKDGVFVYATDNEPGNAEFDKNLRKLAAGADVLVYDAQYLPEEYEARRRGWGHSHWREAVNLVMESGAKDLVLYHHDPDHSDVCIDRVVKEARNYYPKVRAAAEGMEITL